MWEPWPSARTFEAIRREHLQALLVAVADRPKVLPLTPLGREPVNLVDGSTVDL